MQKILIIVLALGFTLISCNGKKESIEQKAAEIHNKVLTVDTHCDTPMLLVMEDVDIGIRNEWENGGIRVDLVKMKEGGLDASFFAVYIGQQSRNEKGNEKAKNDALEVLDSIKSVIERNSNLATICYEPDDAYKNELEGKRSVFIGMENGYPIGNDLTMLNKYHDLGVRYITLCHNLNNDICDSSTDPSGPEFDGLSSFGEDVVREMNRLGILIDVSHMSDSSFFDIIRLSDQPLIASHSCARALCDHPRNLSDEMLLSLVENGGVIQLCLVGAFLKSNPELESALHALELKHPDYYDLSPEEQKPILAEWMAIYENYPDQASVVEAVDHIDHIVKIAGIDHVGIGSDFDGGGGIKGCQDVSEMGNITLELVKRGYTEEDIEKIWGGNFMRVFKEVRKDKEYLKL